MQPTLVAGDLIVMTPYWRRQPQRGDVVVFRSPAGNGEKFVKRVVALPGDLVDAKSGSLRIGGHTHAEPYVARGAKTANIAPQLVPSEHYLVLGDNREVALDSRAWGPIPQRLIVGRARVVLWSSSRRRIFKWIE
jgi:signal peptidase I